MTGLALSLLLAAGAARATADNVGIIGATLVSEAGWSERSDPRTERDHAGMLYVLERIGAGDVVRGAMAYCSVWKTARPGHVWKRELTEKCTRPPSWPERYPRWGVYRRKCLRVMAFARAWLEGSRPPDPCRGKARHFGGHMDPVPPGHVRVDCGDTRQRFYGRPS